MALDSGPVGLSVLLILVLCSLLSWAIIFAKWRGFKEAREASDKFLDLFWNAKSLDSIFAETKSFEASPVSHVFRAGYQEFQNYILFLIFLLCLSEKFLLRVLRLLILMKLLHSELVQLPH